MGAQIAAHLANAGLTVHLLDLAGEGINKNAVVEQGLKQAQALRPNPFFSDEVHRLIVPGNFEDHFDRVAEADWVIEAVIEQPEIKQDLMVKVEQVAREDAIISTNTSGIPMRVIAAGRSEAFQKRFLGTHFFNPPRYLKLLEIVPGAKTDPDVVARLAWFARVGLGKRVVITKDTPGFIGNRVGVYELMHSLWTMAGGDYSIEEIDTLTGPLMGRPSSATFRTADVVGLDTLAHVANFLYGALVEDEHRDVFRLPELLEKLVETGAFGAKTGGGFYRKEGQDILSVNRETLAYEPAKELDLGDLGEIQRLGSVQARVRALYADGGRAGAFVRSHLLNTLGYSARRIPEIADSPADVDRAIRWGFGWEIGPFEMWDAIGFGQVTEDMVSQDISVPDWVSEMTDAGASAFYLGNGAEREVFVPGQGYVSDAPPSDEIHSFAVPSDAALPIWENEEAVLLDMGDDVVRYEFRSKANTMGQKVVRGILEVIDLVEQGNYRGLVIGNAGKHFSVGANLKEMANLVGKSDQLEDLLIGFQKMIQRVHYAGKPVVVATHNMALGGACEITMACTHPVAAAESYIGLVELGVGLIPAGCGTMRLAALAHERAPTEHESHILPYLRQVFETVSVAKVSGSAREAQIFGFLATHARVVMHSDRRLYVAKEEVIRLSNEGYVPPGVRNAIKVLGKPGRAQFEVATYTMQQAKYATEYDRYLAGRLAYVLTGGDLTSSALVHEDYLLELEREVFLSLLGEEKTQARIESILTRNKPLRN